MSTLLGVLVLAASKSQPFVHLFQMFTMMVVFGLLHGLVFLPCAIGLVVGIPIESNQFLDCMPMG